MRIPLKPDNANSAAADRYYQISLQSSSKIVDERAVVVQFRSRGPDTKITDFNG